VEVWHKKLSQSLPKKLSYNLAIKHSSPLSVPDKKGIILGIKKNSEISFED